MMSIKEVLKKQKYYLIAEIGVNYYDIAKKENISVMDAAKLMIRKAHECKIDAVKFQTYTAGKIASKFSPSYWDTTKEPTISQFELFKKFDLFGVDEFKELSDYCCELGIEFFSTPFDFEAADYLESMMNYYKISSSDITNTPFIKHMAKKNKPILLSTGASTEVEIDTALNTIYNVNKDLDVYLLHCVLEYPTPFEHANLNRIVALKEKYPNLIIGYSDHTMPSESMDVLKTAWMLGAQVIEKHFTLDVTLQGNDHYHAMDTKYAKIIIEGLEFIKGTLGKKSLEYLESEKTARRNARRSIVAGSDIKKGQVITRELVAFKRPAHGISPSELDNVLGRKAKSDIEDDTILHYDMLQEKD